jgi:hypothetical protein
MRIRRHITPWQEFRIDRRWLRWLAIGAAVMLGGYLTAYLVIFPAPILPGHQAVPRVLGLTVAEAQAEIQKAQLKVTDGGAEPHPTAPQGVIIWQDPPPAVIAPEGTTVTLVSSAGPSKIPVPDVAGLDAALARSLVNATGLTVAQVESIQTASPTGLAMMTRPRGRRSRRLRSHTRSEPRRPLFRFRTSSAWPRATRAAGTEDFSSAP